MGVVSCMNLFLLDPDHDTCARFHFDKHISKMAVECSQILATAYPPGIARMKQTHFLHPCCLWIRKSLSNFNYAIQYGEALSKEYSFRYNNRRHKCQDDLDWYKANQPDIIDIGFTDPPRAFGEYKNSIPTTSCVFQDYRQYYKTKTHLFSWKNRPTPEWILA